MACVLVDTTICVCWTELGKKESPKTRISLKIWKVAAKPKFIENWKNSWKKSQKFMEFKELGRVWTLFNNWTHFSRANVQILSKEIKRQWFQKLMILMWNILCGYLGRILWFTSPVFQCIIAALLNYTKSHHYRYTCMLSFERKHTFNTARDFQRNYVNLGLTDQWVIVVVGLRQSARRVGV